MRLDRALTLVPAAALIVASVVGTGVFVKARVMTCNVGTPDMVLLVWFVAGLLSLGLSASARHWEGQARLCPPCSRPLRQQPATARCQPCTACCKR